MLSRIAGFIRDVMIAAFLGAGPISDAFFVALKLPNLFRRIFAEGAFSASFVPLYSGMLGKDDHAAAQKFASDAFAVLASMLVVLVAIFMLFMPQVIYAIAPGFADDAIRYNTAIDLSLITFPYILPISFCAFLGGILNSHNKFFAFAAVPIWFNISLIAAMLFLPPYVPSVGYALAIGVAIAGMIQLIWMVIFLLKSNLSINFTRPRLTPKVKRLFALMGPGVIGAGIVQINLLVDMIIASFLPEGSVSYLFYADRLNQLPLGVIGIAIGTALLPSLSRHIKSGNKKAASKDFSQGLELGLLLALPAAIALITISPLIISTLFERGAFDGAATIASAKALSAYAIGLPAFIIIKTLITGFFANEDTSTPVKVSAVIIIINIILSIALIFPLKHVGIALSTGITSWIHALTLWILLKKQNILTLDDGFTHRIKRLIASAFIMGISLWLINHFYITNLETPSQTYRIISLTIITILGTIIYFTLAHITGGFKLSQLKKISS